ncbi:MAG TPA: hypothetical protein VE053_06630 [Allosphingosinicella sp.]|nr:hypothetical protein [Allosphingosinicella sp.]
MRLSPTDLRDKALLALDEAYAEAMKGPVPKSAALKLTLAMLANFTDDRDPFDQFWKEATNIGISDLYAHQVGRRQSLTNAYRRIYVVLGVEVPG